mmetsp:Transcript_2878/g.5681  ORF Transcript_2878/g.5681 Transcript_2878/m.5681 type:complete len:497 (+) Transcript_2878:197-1687(+)
MKRGDISGDGMGAHVRPETIRLVADSVGLSTLAPEVAAVLAPEVEYRMREIIQEALKFMRHSRRGELSTEHLNDALRLHNSQALYGFTSTEGGGFVSAEGLSGVYFLQDKELEFDETMNAPLPKAPLEAVVVPHWLAVEGAQPAIPENPAPSRGRDRDRGGGKRAKADMAGVGGGVIGVATEVAPLAAHVLSKELQIYYGRVVEYLGGCDEGLLDATLASLQSDPGLHQLLPYLARHIQHQVTLSLKNLPLLTALMRALRSLLLNPHHSLEPYLHSLMPSVLTCMVAKRLSKLPTEDHWALREFAACTLALICQRYGALYPAMQGRVSRTLVRAFLDPLRPLPTHFGAIAGLARLGPQVAAALVVPNVASYMALLDQHLAPEAVHQNQFKQHEAMQCRHALQLAVGCYLHGYISSSESSVQARASMSKHKHKAPKPTIIRRNPMFRKPKFAYTSSASSVAPEEGVRNIEGGSELSALVELFGDGLLQFVPTIALTQ